MTDLRDNLRGAGLMAASMACFTVNDTFMKLVSDDLPLMQILFIRGSLMTAILILWAHFLGQLRVTLLRRDWVFLAVRMAAEIGAAVFFLTALFNMPLANATAVLQALPLIVTLGATMFLGEALGWRRLLAIMIGFLGVLLILRPGPDGFNSYALMALVAVGFVALRDLITRQLASEVPSLFIAVSTAGAVTGFAAVAGMGEDWRPVDMQSLSRVVGASIFVLGGYLFSIMAMRVGEVGVVAPFRYTSLIWALLLGLIIFDDWPDAITLIGVAILAGAGLFTLVRERQLRRMRAAELGSDGAPSA